MITKEIKDSITLKLIEQDLEYKFIPSQDWDDLIIYPENYDEDNIWFCLYRWYDAELCRVIAEDSNGNFYGQYTEDEFLTFVKNFRAYS